MIPTLNNFPEWAVQFHQYMDGSWQSKYSDNQGQHIMDLFVPDNLNDYILFRHLINDKIVETFNIPKDVHWFGSWLVVVFNMQHCFKIFYSEDELIRKNNLYFGEFLPGEIGNLKWGRKFSRVDVYQF